MTRPPNWLWTNAFSTEDADAATVDNEREKDRWAAAGRYRRTPRKIAMREDGLDALLDGWRPESPLIDRATRVVAFGSCFAARFAEWLIERGINAAVGDGSEDAIVRNPLENPLTVAQQFRWAFGELSPEHVVWIDQTKTSIQPTPERRDRIRTTLEAADVLLITFGIAEYWLDAASGEPMWRTPLESMYEPARHLHRVATVAEVSQALETIERLRAAFLPETKIVFTVSPQKLSGTFRPVSPLTANSASKAVIRAALDEFLRDHPERNRALFYFPSYEMVCDVMVDPFEDDNTHLAEWHARKVVATFARTFSSIAVDDDPGGGVSDELHQSVQALEERSVALQRICDDRLRVIREQTIAVEALRRICDERLELIRELDRAVEGLRGQATIAADLQRICDERLAVIQELDRAVTHLRAVSTPPLPADPPSVASALHEETEATEPRDEKRPDLGDFPPPGAIS